MGLLRELLMTGGTGAGGIIAPPSYPSTIVSADRYEATRFPQQTRVFRNPRGLQYRYAIITTTEGINLYKSGDGGQTWTKVATILSLTDTWAAYGFVASFDLYDDGSQLIVYVAMGFNQIPLSPEYEVFFRRLRIPDAQSDPIIGALQTLPMAGIFAAPDIKRDRNGYIHVAYMMRRVETIKGTGYIYAEPYLVGTTTANPGDAPSWCTPIAIYVHPDIAHSSQYCRCVLLVFGGVGNIGGFIHLSRNGAGVIGLYGRNIVSFNGTTYTLGTNTFIEQLPPTSQTNIYSYETHEGFKAVVDTADYAHVIYRSVTVNQRLRHRKGNSASTVEAWQSFTVVDGSNNEVHPWSLVLTVDKSVTPNDLYAFYGFRIVETNRIRYRDTPVDTISWSSETTVADDTTRIYAFSAGYRDYVGELHLVYTLYVSPYTVRYYPTSV